MKKLFLLFIVLGIYGLSIPSNAQIAITSSNLSYTQNFNTLTGQPANITALQSGTWQNEVSLPGWYATRTNITYTYGNVGTNVGFFSFSDNSNTPPNRSIGSVADASTGTIYYGVRFVNNTGNAIKTIGISYTGKQWRTNGSAADQNLSFSYKIDNIVNVLQTSGYTNVTALDFISPISNSTVANLNGEQTTNQRSISQSITVNILSGQEVMLRWTDIDNSGGDHGLSIDDLQITFTPDTQPAASTTNVKLGIDAGKVISTGTHNTFIGHNTGYSATTGQYNAYLGSQAGYNTIGATGNTFVGYRAGYNGTGGTNNTFLGREAGIPVNVTASLSNATAIGANASVTASNSIVLGNNANVGIGNTAPNNRLEITASQTNQSGLRLTNLTDGSPVASGTYTKALTVDANGDVILVAGGGGGSTQWTLNGTDNSLTNANSGIVKIGTGFGTIPAGYKLYVSDGILTERVKVALKSDWSDKVFDANYRLLSLNEVTRYIKQNKHLPGVPSASTLAQEGFDLAEMDAILLAKIEELTLYMIRIKHENEQLKRRVKQLEKKK